MTKIEGLGLFLFGGSIRALASPLVIIKARSLYTVTSNTSVSCSKVSRGKCRIGLEAPLWQPSAEK